MNVQQQVLDDRLTLNAGIRRDHHEINGSEWIPQAGVSFKASATTVLKAIVGKGYRNPTIREMYIFPPQNPDLKPERLLNYELSILQALLNNKMKIELNVYYIKGDNLIQVAMVDGKPRNVNTGKIENKGMEVTAKYQATNHLRFSANYSLLDMTYKIRTVPEHKLYFSVNYIKMERCLRNSGCRKSVYANVTSTGKRKFRLVECPHQLSSFKRNGYIFERRKFARTIL